MDTNILIFPQSEAAKQPLAQFIRIGDAHNKLADLHAAGRMPAKRIVVDASRLRHQKELVEAFREGGAEIVLDPEVAELAALNKIFGHVRRAPWADLGQGNPLGPEHFRGDALHHLVGLIATAAVENRVDAVLAPTHFLGDPEFSGWVAIDHQACLALRAALDREGGQHIAIDYLIIAPHTALNDDAFRGGLTESITDLPIENVWVRASGLGTDAGPQQVKRYLSAMAGLHNLGKPIVADHLGGLPGLVSMAFGAVSGVAHGIAERERFDARSWHLPPPGRRDDGFGRAVRIAIPGLGKTGTIKELELLKSAKGGIKLIACGDRRCCLHGFKDMIVDHRRHAAYQAFSQVESLEEVPDLRREHYLLSGPMAKAARLAREIKKLKPTEEEASFRGIDRNKMMKRFHDFSNKMEKLGTTLQNIHEARSDEAPRARPVSLRKPLDSQDEEGRK